ncbi:DNA mismatch repair protein MutL [Virgisporangium aliadipatigenens]|uniref:DNA mismatch repair protein MutL n=1 Tax=Virgisporangium aliadipatigenens TaxID=741659 RepID=UPI001EF213A1|nr:DNA mismatch repair protein MutL [Virgisporangium aliadipatigenens]
MRASQVWVPVLGWCASTLASIAVGMVALQPVLRAAAPPPAPDLAARAPQIAGQPAPSLPSALPSATPSGSRSAGPSATGSPRAASPPAAGGAEKTPTVVDGWTVTTSADGTKTYMRSFRVAGGQAVIRMTPGKVTLVSATPNPGYSVDTVQNEPGNLAVQFTEANHYFIIHALWHNNAPFSEVSEVGN